MYSFLRANTHLVSPSVSYACILSMLGLFLPHSPGNSSSTLPENTLSDTSCSQYAHYTFYILKSTKVQTLSERCMRGTAN